MIQEKIIQDVQNLSSRKLWNIVQTGSNKAESIDVKAMIFAAEKELIARKEFNKVHSFKKPH